MLEPPRATGYCHGPVLINQIFARITFDRDMEEFATSTHTDTTKAQGRTIQPSETGKTSLACQYAEVVCETVPTTVSIFHK